MCVPAHAEDDAAEERAAGEGSEAAVDAAPSVLAELEEEDAAFVIGRIDPRH